MKCSKKGEQTLKRIYDIIGSDTMKDIVPSLPILFPFFVSCPFPSSVFVLNLPLPQSAAVLSTFIFQFFSQSSHLSISIPLPFSFHLFLSLYLFLNLLYHCSGLATTPVLPLLLALTFALILALVFFPSYAIVLMSPLFCSCFPSPVPLSLLFFIAFNLFFALFT